MMGKQPSEQEPRGSYGLHRRINQITRMCCYWMINCTHGYASKAEIRELERGQSRTTSHLHTILTRLTGKLSRPGSIEAPNTNPLTPRPLRFNPTLVRLRAKDYYPMFLTILFQSHAGSIEARIRHAPGSSEQGFNPTLVRLRPYAPPNLQSGSESFNPTLVRLRPSRSRTWLASGPSFNPTLVRLRPRKVGRKVRRLLSFNPTLVRLRRRSNKDGNPQSDRFQSHAGSIEASYHPASGWQ